MNIGRQVIQRRPRSFQRENTEALSSNPSTTKIKNKTEREHRSHAEDEKYEWHHTSEEQFWK
jgi:hypothetical protein